MYYIVEIHHGDNNDNNIRSCIVEANSTEEVFSILKPSMIGWLGCSDTKIEEDGDTDSLYLKQMLTGQTLYGEPYVLHCDATIEGVFTSEEDAQKRRSSLHGEWVYEDF